MPILVPPYWHSSFALACHCPGSYRDVIVDRLGDASHRHLEPPPPRLLVDDLRAPLCAVASDDVHLTGREEGRRTHGERGESEGREADRQRMILGVLRQHRLRGTCGEHTGSKALVRMHCSAHVPLDDLW